MNSCLIVQHLAKAVYEAVIICAGGVTKDEVQTIDGVNSGAVRTGTTLSSVNLAVHMWHRAFCYSINMVYWWKTEVRARVTGVSEAVTSPTLNDTF